MTGQEGGGRPRPWPSGQQPGGSEDLQDLVLDDRYRLGGRLGRGGMADVLGAFDERLHRRVAVKLLRAAGAEPERFAAEIRTLARLEHPNIVRLLDAGTAPDGRPYLVMELVEGESLATRCARGPLPDAELVEAVRGIATGLAYVHARGIVHRDVKPGNILLGPEDRVRLADFGVARLVDTGGLTATGLVIGTPAYLAPEQLVGGTVGPPADLYALGLVLAECLTGRRVFDGTPAEAAAARLHPGPLALEGVPDRWRPLLSSLTAVEPGERPAASGLAQLLPEPAGRGPVVPEGDTIVLAAPTAAPGGRAPSRPGEPDTVVGPAAAARDATVPLQATEPLPPPAEGSAKGTRRSRRPLLAGAALALLALAGLGIAQLVGPDSPRDPGHQGTLVTSSPGTASSTTRPASTSTATSSSTTTSSSSTTTTTSSTTTTAPPSPVAAGRSLLSAIAAGRQAGTVSQAAAAQLYGALRNLYGDQGSTAALTAGVTQLGNLLDRQVSSGQVSGGSAEAIESALGALAASLGVPAPAGPPATGTTAPAPTTSPTTTSAGGPPGQSGGGPRQGNGPGPGGGPGHHRHLAGS